MLLIWWERGERRPWRAVQWSALVLQWLGGVRRYRMEGGLQDCRTAVEGQLTPSTSTLHTTQPAQPAAAAVKLNIEDNRSDSTSDMTGLISGGVTENLWGFLTEISRKNLENNEARLDSWTGGQETDRRQISKTKEKTNSSWMFSTKLSQSWNLHD